MSDVKVYDILPEAAQKAYISETKYQEMYTRSITEPDVFWAEQAKEFVTWFKGWDTVQNCDYHDGKIRWFEGGKTNVSYNCLDRHLETRGDQVAIIWEGDNPKVDKKITYRQLHEQVCRFSNVLKERGVKKGDRICIYMPMIPEAAVAMLASTRIGAIHSVVFGGFSPEALKDRILDSGCDVVITADEGLRGGRAVPLKANVDKALTQCPNVHTVVV
ncbi:MAG: AMP-binding protein, partial [Thiomargarita sp.]|nr:AMP-binding protein [Thiomargarita sp.]